jgi:hypothetical protein
VTVAVEYAEIGAPRADRSAVLVSHDARDLVDVSEVVHGPGGEKVRERNIAESGMKSAKREIFGAQTQGGKFTEILGAQASELVE